MNKSTALATRDQRLAALAVQDVRTLIPGLNKCSDAEVKGFILYCKAVDADPWAREIYLIKYDEKGPAAIVLALNWYLRRASHNPAYESFESGLIVERQGQFVDVVGSIVYPGDKLLGGWCRVHKKGAANPFERRVAMQEYDRRQAGWLKMPATMIEKVAIVQAVRRAFPDEFATEETQQGMPVVLEGDVDLSREEAALPSPAVEGKMVTEEVAPQEGQVSAPLEQEAPILPTLASVDALRAWAKGIGYPDDTAICKMLGIRDLALLGPNLQSPAMTLWRKRPQKE